MKYKLSLLLIIFLFSCTIMEYKVVADILVINGILIENNEDSIITNDYLNDKPKESKTVQQIPILTENNKIGVSFDILGNNFVESIKLTQSELAYILKSEDYTKVKLSVILSNDNCSDIRLHIYLGRRRVINTCISGFSKKNKWRLLGKK